MLITIPFLLLLSSGGHALVPFVDKFIQGGSEESDAAEDRLNHLARKDTDGYPAKTLRDILYGAVGSKMRHETLNHFVQQSKDDEDLDLVMNFLRGGSYSRTDQLSFNSLPVLESDLVKDILNVIYSRPEYLRILNNPEKSVMANVVKEMIRLPIQDVLQQQLYHKIVAGRAWRQKVIDPMMQGNKRNTLLNFGRHLLEAKQNGNLSTEDTTDFKKQLKNIAFFDREDDEEFKNMVDSLIQAFGQSVNQTQDNESTVRSDEQAAKKLNANRHGFEFRTTSRYGNMKRVTSDPSCEPDCDPVPPEHKNALLNRNGTKLEKDNANKTSAGTTRSFRSMMKAPLKTTEIAEDITTPRYVPTSKYVTTRDYRSTTQPPYTTTGNDFETTTAEYVPTSKYRTTRGYEDTTEGLYTTTVTDQDTTTPRYVPTSGYVTTRDYRSTTQPPYTTTGNDFETTTAEYVPTSKYRTTRGYEETTEGRYTTRTADGTTTAEYVPTSPYPLTTTDRYETTTDSYETSNNKDYTTTPVYKLMASSFTKQRKSLEAFLPFSNKSNRAELKNSSGNASSIVKDIATENPIVYIQGVNEDDDDDSFDSGIKKDFNKKTENKAFTNLDKNHTNKTSTEKSFDNLNQSPKNSHKG